MVLSKKMFQIHRFKSLLSTNTEAKNYPPNSVIIADIQTAGRGRFNRKWNSSEGGIYMSIVVEPLNDNLSILTFLAALSVNKTLHEMFKLNSEIKWPNDILFKGKKLCGILAENIFQGDKKQMIIGIGINANNKISKSIKAISLGKILSKATDNDSIISEVLKNFEDNFEKYYKTKKFSSIIQEFKKNCSTIGKEVEIKTITETIKGSAIDIAEDCGLIIKTSDNITRKIYEGDIFTI